MRYYGCKNKLLNFLSDGVAKTGINSGAIFCDLFSGTTTVARYFKQKGYTVYANDFLEFSYALAKTYIELNEEPKFLKLKKYLKVGQIDKNYVIGYLNNLSPKKGFIFNNYCPNGKGQRQYFSNENGQKIDAIREKIEEWKNLSVISELEYYYLITAVLEAVNLVSNVAGTYSAYLKIWDKRAIKPLILTSPEIIPSKRKNKAFKKDANQLIKEVKNIDILYLDPPYNSRQYAANYFILELIAEGWFNEKPKIYGKTGMRSYENQKSDFCQKNSVLDAFNDIIEKAKTKFILLSYNDEGLMSEKEITNTLSKRGKVEIFKKPYRRYRSINQDNSDRRIVYEKLYFVKVSER